MPGPFVRTHHAATLSEARVLHKCSVAPGKRNGHDPMGRAREFTLPPAHAASRRLSSRTTGGRAGPAANQSTRRVSVMMTASSANTPMEPIRSA